MSFGFTGHDQLESKTLKPTQEGKPASKPGADAAGKDASAKDTSAKGASAKLAPAKGALAKASSKKPEKESSAGRGSHKASEKVSEKVSEKSTDKGHLVARDTRRSGDRPPTGRSGQKRARSRYVGCANLQCGTSSISLQVGSTWPGCHLQDWQTLDAC